MNIKELMERRGALYGEIRKLADRSESGAEWTDENETEWTGREPRVYRPVASRIQFLDRSRGAE